MGNVGAGGEDGGQSFNSAGEGAELQRQGDSPGSDFKRVGFTRHRGEYTTRRILTNIASGMTDDPLDTNDARRLR